MVRQSRRHHGMCSKANSHGHHGMHDRFDALAHIPQGRSSRACFDEALEGDQHFQGLHLTNHQYIIPQGPGEMPVDLFLHLLTEAPHGVVEARTLLRPTNDKTM